MELMDCGGKRLEWREAKEETKWGEGDGEGKVDCESKGRGEATGQREE
jgi:hypothetical protein